MKNIMEALWSLYLHFQILVFLSHRISQLVARLTGNSQCLVPKELDSVSWLERNRKKYDNQGLSENILAYLLGV